MRADASGGPERPEVDSDVAGNPSLRFGRRGGEGEQWSRSEKGTPQGGVISPLLANLYLHWFDKAFHRPGGPAHWAGARLVRYADDFVVLSGYPGKRLYGWIESKLEQCLKLVINRDKTRVINLGEEKASLESLGYTFRWNRDRYGRNSRYLHVGPSNKALQRERDKLAAMTDSHQCHKRWWVSLASAKLDKPCTTCVDPHQTGGLYG